MLSYPDYKRCLINIISSVKGYYRTPFEYPTLSALDKELGKYYKNIVLIVLDGLGSDMLQKNLALRDFLKEHQSCNLTSVFPSSTAAAMTSYYTGVSPNEHSWLGRSLYFKEFHSTIDIASNVDSYTKVPFTRTDAASFVMPYETIYQDIKKSIIGNVQPFTIAPKRINIAERGNFHKVVSDFSRGCETIKKICETKQNTFTFFQWDEPSHTALKHGCYAEETADVIRRINNDLSMLYGSVTDTLFIISSDHGMTDLEDEVKLHQIPELSNCFVIPPFCEGRAMSFYIKYDKRADFERIFQNYFSGDFVLLSKRDILSKEILGVGKAHPKTLDFIGDYMACAIGGKTLCYRTLNAKPKPMDAAGHGGFTDLEMEIPLIIAATEQTVKPAKIF
ncbi:MAG: alkaline phosphatase family protein [Oscillospiraceae bacterium]|nr:alkaline phosphatase family protein [Oscillospiraceae bacterium]